MSGIMLIEVPQWYAIYTKPKQEERAESNLRAWGVETLDPTFKQSRPKHGTHRTNYVIKQLFPRYIFAHFNASILLRDVYFTRGVHSVVSFDNKPSPVDDEIISQIRERICGDGYVHLDDLKSGDKVIVKNGPLSNIVGMLEKNMTASDRVSILLTNVNYQARVLLLREQVDKLSECELRDLAAERGH